MRDQSPTPAEAAIVALLDIAHAAEAAAVALKEATVTEPSFTDNTAAVDNAAVAAPAPDAGAAGYPPDAPGVSPDAAGGGPAAGLPTTPDSAAPTIEDAIALVSQALAVLQQL